MLRDGAMSPVDIDGLVEIWTDWGINPKRTDEESEYCEV
jgi:hypothetical protein